MAWDLADSILIGLLLIIVAMLMYNIGVSKGEKSLRARSDLIRPSLKDIQIEGSFEVKKGDLNDIVKMINKEEYITSNFFNILKQGNRIILQSTRIINHGKDYLKRLGEIRPGIPHELVLFFKEKDDEHFLIETLCRPIMYYQISQSVQFDFLQTNVEDAQAQCIQFTKEIMNSLNAKIIKYPATINKEELFIYDYYSNTPQHNEIDLQVQQILSTASNEILYCGWVDREFLGYLENAKTNGANVRIITKSPDASSKTVKLDFERLKGFFKDNVKINPLLHDRFLICDDQLIVGSYYLTSDGRTRYESVIYTSDDKIILRAKQHFELIWNDQNSHKA
jgi:hypothetical protein